MHRRWCACIWRSGCGCIMAMASRFIYRRYGLARRVCDGVILIYALLFQIYKLRLSAIFPFLFRGHCFLSVQIKRWENCIYRLGRGFCSFDGGRSPTNISVEHTPQNRHTIGWQMKMCANTELRQWECWTQKFREKLWEQDFQWILIPTQLLWMSRCNFLIFQFDERLWWW